MSTKVPENLRPHLAPLLCLAVAALVVYGRILGHDFQVVWDDDLYVIDNPMVHGLTGEHVRRAFSGQYFGNYAPLHLISYMLDFELWGMRPEGYLLTNLCLHVVNGLLLFRLVARLHAGRLMATVAAAVFLLHPLQVESVAWVSQRKNLLAMLFFLLAWECYRRYRESAGRERWRFYIGTLVLFACSLLSKSVAVIFPVVMVLYDLCFADRSARQPMPEGGDVPPRTRESASGGCGPAAAVNDLQGSPAGLRALLQQVSWLDKLPFVLATAAAVWMTMQSQAPAGDNWDGGGGGRVGYHGGSPLATFFSMLPVFCRYLGLLFWPAGLNVLYDPPVYTSFNVIVAAAGGVLLLVGWCCWRLLRHDPRAGFWALVFWAGFLPVSQVVPLVTMMNDRYVYFPMVGFAALAGYGCRRLQQILPDRARRVLPLTVAGALSLLSVASFQRVSDWRDTVTLWSDSVAKAPGNAAGWISLGQSLERTGGGDAGAALAAYGKAAALDPDNHYAIYGMARIYGFTGQYDKALQYVTKLLKRSPNHVMGLTLLGTVQQNQGRYEEAERTFQRAAELQPEAVEIAMLRAELSVKRGEYEKARTRYLEIESRMGAFPVVAYMLAWLELKSGRQDTALSWLEKALQRGYADYRGIDDLLELTPLHENPRFEQLMKQYGRGR